MAEYLEEEV